MERFLNLHLFDGAAGGGDGGGAGSAGGGDGGTAAGGTVTGGSINGQTVTTAEAEARQAAFDSFIAENKDLYDARVEKQLSRRFRDTERLRADSDRLAKLGPTLSLLQQRYGTADGDIDALMEAIEGDNAYYEEAAMDAGMTVEQYKEMQRLERENAELRQMRETQEQQKRANARFEEWMKQAEACKQFYPSFDLEAELQGENGERMMKLMTSGVDVRTAFEVIYKDDILGGAMAKTAQTIAQKTVNGIRSRGMRPRENGVAGNNAPVAMTTDVNKMTKKEREEIARRVMRGERIVL